MTRAPMLTAMVILAATIVACDDTASDSRQLTATNRAFTLDNWHAIKFPIRTTLSQTEAHFQADRDSAGTVVTCNTPSVRATEWDANGRQIADGLGVWSSDDTSIAVVDSLGWAHATHCYAPTIMWDSAFGANIRFTLTNAK